MLYRVTNASFFDQSVRYAQEHAAQIARIQAQLSSGKKIQRPSDDPQVYQLTSTQQARDNRLEAFRQNVEAAEGYLNTQVSQLLSAKNIFVRAKELAMEGRDQQEPEVLAAEVESLIQQLLQIANAHMDGKYLFAGAAVDQIPFQLQQGTGGSQVVYVGAETGSETVVGDAVTALVHLPGSQVFGPQQRQPTVYVGSTGAQPGTGTDSGTGFGQLQVTHTLTTYSGGSGVQPGASSPGGDTILGPMGSHQLAITDTSGTGAFGTISLNGGEPVAFTDADTDLRVEGPAGEVVMIDTTSITAGFSGTVDVGADGTLSTDEGLSSTPITFGSNQGVQHSSTGAWTYVDTTELRRTGTEYLEYQGTSTAFEVLSQLRDDLRNERGLQGAEYQEAISRRMGEVDRILDAILDATGRQSAVLSGLETTSQQLDDLQLATRERISRLSDTDFGEATMRLQQAHSLLQFTYASSLRMMSTSLLDFLR